MAETRRKWLIFSMITFLLLFISMFIYGIFLYMDLNSERTEGHEATKRELLKQTEITEISKIENFNGEAAYHVVYGKSEEGNGKIIFYPLEGNEKTLTTVDSTEVLAPSSMIDRWQSDCRTCQLVKITPALLDEEILWELVYYDENDRYVFDYRSIYDGSDYEEIRYLRKFN
ncbi:cell wall elongation regulator TseB-like domain-containing protein [Oceanobacillus alkalisoli]|uniref:cell wall elongation regulator TseB-like domain-containing protein n=1 Tax=Oceanobacillus alkalisoli TaxID=2925113 RepID=UPI001EF07060|nr:DUF5590 domain-containing protein [Oceanobacillus alkalisoli]MCF3941616.1 DUF5590 domain-containing protein [Oceanobacillus alkalisoli]MCG5102898.1 DUF5590 domain-containing protein [Oceanobacillus alkalisoli]